MLTKDLTTHFALVTGATGAIGSETCRALATNGCSVAVHYHSAADKATALVQELRGKGVRAEAFQADFGSYDDIRSLHAAVVSTLGHPTILFNNAGSNHGRSGVKSASEISIEDFEKTWRANCGSAFLLTQLCLPAMETKGWGRIIFNSSVAAFTGGLVGPHYASSKSAQHGLLHWLSQSYCRKGITVNGIAPALIEGAAILPKGPDGVPLASKIPVGFLGQPDEIAETVLWLVRTGYVTSKVIGVDGGMYPQ